MPEALCFGWIDGQAKPLDATRSQRLLTPRKPKSKWSGLNKAWITELTAAGLMHPAGQAMVELAKRTGTWTALDAVEALVEPDELRAALDANLDARRYGMHFRHRHEGRFSSGSGRPNGPRLTRSGSWRWWSRRR